MNQQKKERGRPRKNPVVETVTETKKEEYTVDMPKKNAVVLVKIQKLYHKKLQKIKQKQLKNV